MNIARDKEKKNGTKEKEREEKRRDVMTCNFLYYYKLIFYA